MRAQIQSTVRYTIWFISIQSKVHDKACDILLRGGLSTEATEYLRCLTIESDVIDDQNFSPVYKIVLRLSLQDLEPAILQDADDVDITDAMGRTALEWVAVRGDERSVVTLLSYGADPKQYAFDFGRQPEPNVIPLNCAARNASDPFLLKTLLDFDADIEASKVDGVTPLLQVARSNSASHAMILLDYGANINVISKDGRTPLTTPYAYGLQQS
ncbi:hypothetical protein MMC17_009476 [Xylographa soralifera]|nr:hypothetical protein [Xylographa soralifera]